MDASASTAATRLPAQNRHGPAGRGRRLAPPLPCSEIFLDVILPSCKCVLNTCSKPQAAACILSLWDEMQISFDGPSRSAALPLFGACNPSRKRGIVIRNPKKFVEGWF